MLHQKLLLTKPAMVVLATVALIACSGGSNEYREDESSTAELSVAAASGNTASVNEPSGAESSVLFEDEATRLNDLPAIVYSETLDATDLEVAYTTGLQRDWIEPDYVEAQWLHMLSCTGVSLQTPRVVIVEGEALPLHLEDDVIRYIDGRTVASSSVDEQGPVLQVSEFDFDGSLGSVGFNLRAIIGRYLWLTASLAERDYPFVCSRG